MPTTTSEPIIDGKILILGSGGQVGSALTGYLGKQAIAVDFPEIDLSKPETLASALDELCKGLSAQEQPRAVINAAAYTQVDRAETETSLSEAINGDSPGVLASWCRARRIPLIHYSTDYVYNGRGETPWREADPTGPTNAYGHAKLRGDQNIASQSGSFLIFRTSWVYDAVGKNFLKTMLRLGMEREELKVVSDQYGAPTYAPHLAQATLRALSNAWATEAKTGSFPSGVYHLCNTGVTTWHGFAARIFEQCRALALPFHSELKVQRVLPLRTEDYPTPASRPHNSRMNTDKAEQFLGVRLPSWEVGLTDCLALLAGGRQG